MSKKKITAAEAKDALGRAVIILRAAANNKHVALAQVSEPIRVMEDLIDRLPDNVEFVYEDNES